MLRKLQEGDKKILFDWVNDPEVRKMSVNTEPVLWEDHEKWFESKLKDKNTRIFLLTENDQKIGQVRFHLKNSEWLIGYSIAKEFRGKGYGRQILIDGLKEMQTGRFIAYVKPANLASLKIFLELKFEQSPEIEDENTGLIKFSLNI